MFARKSASSGGIAVKLVIFTFMLGVCLAIRLVEKGFFGR